MKTTHTAGPWVRNMNLIQSADGDNIAEILPTDSRGQANANAALIAAAPDVLAALQLAADELQLVSDEQEGRFGGTMDKLLAAIEKATGGN